MDITESTGILIGLSSLIIGWIIYDLLCKSRLAKNVLVFGVILFAFVALSAWFLTSVFSARAALYTCWSHTWNIDGG